MNMQTVVGRAMTIAALCLSTGVTGARPTCLSQDTSSPGSSIQQLRTAYFGLEDEFKEALSNWSVEYRTRKAAADAAEARGERSAFVAPERVEAGFLPRFERLVEAGSADAQVWIVLQHRLLPVSGEEARRDKRRRVLLALAGDLARETQLALAMELSQDGLLSGGGEVLEKDECIALMGLMYASATDEEVRGVSGYYRAALLDNRSGPREARRVAMSAYRDVATQLPDSDWGRRAYGKVFNFEKLNIGQTAPGIEGTDVDGNPMRLSDFAGKVVLLDFWGFW
ncbi:MAG: hypothetical protein ACJAQ3_003134 [Planctomycetota bacterium]|jgi:hypothetical protein